MSIAVLLMSSTRMFLSSRKLSVDLTCLLKLQIRPSPVASHPGPPGAAEDAPGEEAAEVEDAEDDVSKDERRVERQLLRVKTVAKSVEHQLTHRTSQEQILQDVYALQTRCASSAYLTH